MKKIYKKELLQYFNKPFGYIVVVLFALFANFLFIKDVFVVGSASMRPFFNIASLLLIVFVPALTMRLFAEEKKSQTLEMLLTLPITERDILLGKFFAVLTIITISLALTLGLPISLSYFSRLYLPEIIVGYIGLLFMASLFASIGIYFSQQTTNQIVAFLLTSVALFILYAFSTEFVASVVPVGISQLLTLYTPVFHLETFLKGILDARSLIYFISLIVLMLFMAYRSLRTRS